MCCLIPICSFSSLGLRHAKSDTKRYPYHQNHRVTEALCPQKGSLESSSLSMCHDVHSKPSARGLHQTRTHNMNRQSWTKTIAIWYSIIYISDFCITKSCVHAPNTVKRYSALRKMIPMSHRSPWLLLSLACRSCAKQHFGLIRQWSSLH